MNFSEAVATFLKAATWLDDSHAPSVIALEAVARELDVEVTGALVAQFGLLHRSLLKAKPEVTFSADPMEALLTRVL
jgi:hypothetical protein